MPEPLLIFIVNMILMLAVPLFFLWIITIPNRFM